MAVWAQAIGVINDGRVNCRCRATYRAITRKCILIRGVQHYRRTSTLPAPNDDTEPVSEHSVMAIINRKNIQIGARQSVNERAPSLVECIE